MRKTTATISLAAGVLAVAFSYDRSVFEGG